MFHKTINEYQYCIYADMAAVLLQYADANLKHQQQQFCESVVLNLIMNKKMTTNL